MIKVDIKYNNIKIRYQIKYKMPNYAGWAYNKAEIIVGNR